MRSRSWFASFLIGVTLAGCGTSDGAGPQPDAPLLDSSGTIPPGALCALGGTAIHTGRDRNGDGVLDPDEVEHATTVCNADGPATLVRIDVEPPGAQCYSGGHVVRTGPDRNRDGVLGDDEVIATTYTCDALEVFHGDFTAAMWADPAAVAALQDARVIVGSLTVSRDAPVSLPRLEIVGGTMTVLHAGTPTGLELPALAQVGADFILRDVGFSGDLAVPALARVGGSFEILEEESTIEDGHRFSAPALTEVGNAVVVASGVGGIAAVDLHQLRSVGGALEVDNLLITELALPALTSVGGNLIISRTYGLASLDLSGLRSVGGELGLADSLRLSTIDLPVLRETAGLSFDICNVRQLNLPALTAVHGRLGVFATPLQDLSLPLLRVIDDDLEIQQSAKLVHVSLPALESVGERPATPARPWSIQVSGGAGGGALRSVDLPRLASAPDGVAIVRAHELTAVALPALTRTQRLMFTSVPALASVTAPALTSVGSITIDAPALIELSLPRLATVSERLELDHTQLVDLRGLASATVIANLVLDKDPMLGSLAGLEQLTRIADQLTLTGDATLASLAALANLTTVGGAITVTDDPALSPDEVAALIRRVHP